MQHSCTQRIEIFPERRSYGKTKKEGKESSTKTSIKEKRLRILLKP